METQTLIWINTLVLLVAAIAEIGGLVILGALLVEQRKASRISEERLAAMLESIAHMIKR